MLRLFCVIAPSKFFHYSCIIGTWEPALGIVNTSELLVQSVFVRDQVSLDLVKSGCNAVLEVVGISGQDAKSGPRRFIIQLL